MGSLDYGDNIDILRRNLKDDTFKKASASKRNHGEQTELDV
jgi:hypothetical protein